MTVSDFALVGGQRAGSTVLAGYLLDRRRWLWRSGQIVMGGEQVAHAVAAVRRRLCNTALFLWRSHDTGFSAMGEARSADARGVPLAEETSYMQIRIEGTDLPGRSCGPSADVPGGYRNIHVGVQRHGKRDELLGLTPGDAPAAIWTIECQLSGGRDRNGLAADVRGPCIQGPPGGRFIYLNWVTVDDAGELRLFRRAKLWLDGVPPAVLAEAAGTGLLIGRLGLTDPKGYPACSAGRPPTIEWSAGSP